MTLTSEEQKAFFILMGIPGKGVDICDEESLKKAFRNKAKKSHPDLAAHMGKDPRLMKLRFQELNDAFNILMERIQKEQTSFTARPVSSVKPGATARPTAPGAGKAGTKSERKASGKSSSRTKTAKKSTASGVYAKKTTTRSAPGGKHNERVKKAGKTAAEKNNSGAASGKKKGEQIFFNGKTPGRNLRFAEYLYYSGFISWTDLVQALVWQYRNRPKLGELATECGLLDFAEVLDVIRAKNPFELFGEAAVRLGYLSPEKLDSLVREQKKMGCPIGNYFTSSNLMTTETLHKKLSENRRHNFHFSDVDSGQ